MVRKAIILFASSFNIILEIDRKYNFDYADVYLEKINEEDKDKIKMYKELTNKVINLILIRKKESFEEVLFKVLNHLSFTEDDEFFIFIPRGDSHLAFAVFLVYYTTCLVYNLNLKVVFIDLLEGLNKVVFTELPDLTKIYSLNYQDTILLDNITKGKTINEIASLLNLSPATISIRLKALDSLGIIKKKGRKTELNLLGKIIKVIGEKKSEIKVSSEVSKEEILSFIKSCKKYGGYSPSPETKVSDIISTVNAIASMIILNEKYPNARDLGLDININIIDNQDAIMLFKYSKIYLNSRYAFRLSLLLNYFPDIRNRDILLERLKDYLNSLKYNVEFDNRTIVGFSFKRNQLPSINSTYEVILAKYVAFGEIDYSAKEYVLSCIHENGGFKMSPMEQEQDLSATFNGLALSKLYNLTLKNEFLKLTKRYIISLWKETGFSRPNQKISTLWNNYDAVMSLLLIDRNFFNKYENIRKELINIILSRYKAGAFINVPGSSQRLSYIYPALSILKLLGFKSKSLSFSPIKIDLRIGFPVFKKW